MVSLPAFAEQPPLEVYGELQIIRSMAISPNGEYIAYLNREGDQEALIIYKTGEGPIGGVRTDNVKANSVSFFDNDHVILRVSETTRIRGYIGRHEYGVAFAYNIKSGKIKQLLKDTEDLYPGQTNLGSIVAAYKDGKHVLMQAYFG